VKVFAIVHVTVVVIDDTITVKKDCRVQHY
jgi:hypothetical protein